ncbi:putative hydro-lyase [Desulforhopalus sp. IMCC35007]|uniref:putative hydro-lyase n=1 Tax=Desulforhopalus sp. IMCC35007 TaxID=2569543 RepID=UPI0010AEE298|nr:putative hydro-lyase [Desulforhopalus sp. IMCC35007]TKB08827.1 putative hydro-lyase [Desulforhopalus sp. IMCC35007]
MTPEEFRALSAAGKFELPTAGYCPGFVQANLAAFPKKYAADFKAFCKANPKPCPLLEVIGPETSLSKKLAPGADIRDVIPRYQIWRDGACAETVSNLKAIDTTDFVYFLLGCSFSFEEALIEAGIYLRHVDQKKNVAMYRTNIKLESVGIFAGNMVVSMRPIRRDQVEQASQITGMFPDVHGAPVHVGDPGKIGIVDINNPDYGEFVEIKEDELPVFWACGVTPQNVLRSAKLPFAITHAPGFMFVSDIKNKDYACTQ